VLRPNAHLRTVLDCRRAWRGWDGGAGFGHAIGREAMELGISRARTDGQLHMALGNAHAPRPASAPWPSWRGRRALGLAALRHVNRADRRAFGGADARFGTNPFTAGIRCRACADDPGLRDQA